jgi:phosphomannomutase
MKVNRDIFKEYDIRGKYPREINAKVVCQISRAFAKFLKLKEKDIIVVGRDKRPSSEILTKAFIAGLANFEVSVLDIGKVSTPMLYFAVPFLGASGGVMITASHLSQNNNGIKFVRRDAQPIGGKEIQKIYEIAKNQH